MHVQRYVTMLTKLNRIQALHSKYKISLFFQAKHWS